MIRAATFQMKTRDISVSIPDKRHGGKRTAAWLAFAVIGAALFISGCASVRVKDTSRTFKTVVIDAGHGGKDNGTRSRWAGFEKNATLDVAQRLEPKLRAAGFHTVMTRNSDVFIELNDRAAISNRQHNAIFISIHFNDAGRRRAIRGTEVYYRSPESLELARRILSSIAALPGASSRGVKTANFRVLKRNEYPAVLIECGYFSNRTEACRCATPAYREQLANAIAEAVKAQRYSR